MANVEKVSVSLTPELSAMIGDAVRTGEYGSASEVIRDALRHWKERRDLFGYTLDELRRFVQEGIDSGPGTFGTMEAIKLEARRRAKGSAST